VDWRTFCLRLIGRIQQALRERDAEVAHLKLHLQAGGNSLFANLTGGDRAASLRGAIEGAPRRATVLLNARVCIEPQALRALVEQCLESACSGTLAATITRIQSFAPARPEPTHRFDTTS
jgi:hypothetical protein